MSRQLRNNIKDKGKEGGQSMNRQVYGSNDRVLVVKCKYVITVHTVHTYALIHTLQSGDFKLLCLILPLLPEPH